MIRNKIAYSGLVIGLFCIVVCFNAFGLGIFKLSVYDKSKTTAELNKQLKQKNLKLGSYVFMRIFKETKELEVWLQQKNGKYTLFKTYPICYYSGELGPKLKQGDKQAPEGFL
ncbi:MAG: hypothetical protein GY804_03575 [Alphaproteobacteria bacterium]|nr:hypothetical protein [Alphaproteobacteria bacterium]